jgi:hypothetical protein
MDILIHSIERTRVPVIAEIHRGQGMICTIISTLHTKDSGPWRRINSGAMLINKESQDKK